MGRYKNPTAHQIVRDEVPVVSKKDLAYPSSYEISYDPDLVPPVDLMVTETPNILEEWFRWAEEWSMILRVFGKLNQKSHVLEIGCGLGRIAFPLRCILSSEGRYDGFDIVSYKIDFLKHNFEPKFPNFVFSHADLLNTFYNPTGKINPREFYFPYPDCNFDLVFAASVFTHMLPGNTQWYFAEAARVVKSGGICVFSFFLLDRYLKSHNRPGGFAHARFNFDYSYGNFGNKFAISNPENPEEMTAYNLSLLIDYAQTAGLYLDHAPIPGLWSGTTKEWISMQDLLIFKKY